MHEVLRGKALDVRDTAVMTLDTCRMCSILAKPILILALP